MGQLWILGCVCVCVCACVCVRLCMFVRLCVSGEGVWLSHLFWCFHLLEMTYTSKKRCSIFLQHDRLLQFCFRYRHLLLYILLLFLHSTSRSLSFSFLLFPSISKQLKPNNISFFSSNLVSNFHVLQISYVFTFLLFCFHSFLSLF